MRTLPDPPTTDPACAAHAGLGCEQAPIIKLGGTGGTGGTGFPALSCRSLSM
jgi:hypothetical protein